MCVYSVGIPYLFLNYNISFHLKFKEQNNKEG